VKSESRNITLALPERLLRQVKILAAERHTSVSRLLADTLELLVSREAAFERAKARGLKELAEGHDLGTTGSARWHRDDLHAR
jgi:predicted transcriptional regulator